LSLSKQSIADFLDSELKSMGIDLVDIELSSSRKPLLRLYVDRIGETQPECTLKVSDCEEVSRMVQRLIDVEGIIRTDYTLEVSTPGLERPLYKMDDYKRFKGKLANIVIVEPVGGSFVGRIQNVNTDTIVFEVEGKTKEVKISDIKRAKLKFER